MTAEGNYYCNLCTGTEVSPEKKDLEFCQYLDLPVTDEFASKRFWMLPYEYFETRMSEIEDMINFASQSLKTQHEIRQELTNILYAQLVTILEVYLREKFKVGMINPDGFDNFVKRHIWENKYYPSEVHGNIKRLVSEESEKVNFQNFVQVGNVYKEAFNIDIFSFSKTLKGAVNRILRYRHCIVHQGEIWENHRLIRIDLPQLQQDIIFLKEFVSRIDSDFEKSIGTPYDNLVEQGFFGSLNLRPTDEKVIKQNLDEKQNQE
jgi:hypothetical protein